MKIIKGVHHVSLKCDGAESFKKTLDFYCGVIGLELKRSWEGGAMIDAGNCIIELFESGRASDKTGSINHFAFNVDNVDECVEIIKNAGYQITLPPMDIVIPAEPAYPVRIAFCVGPVGEEIEIFCEK